MPWVSIKILLMKTHLMLWLQNNLSLFPALPSRPTGAAAAYLCAPPVALPLQLSSRALPSETETEQPRSWGLWREWWSLNHLQGHLSLFLLASFLHSVPFPLSFIPSEQCFCWYNSNSIPGFYWHKWLHSQFILILISPPNGCSTTALVSSSE